MYKTMVVAGTDPSMLARRATDLQNKMLREGWRFVNSYTTKTKERLATCYEMFLHFEKQEK